jgi:hypothetical protein
MMGKEFSTMTKFPATSIPAWHNARNKNFKIKFHNQNHQQVPDIHSHTIQLVPVLNLSKLQVSIDSVCVVFLNSSPSFHQWRCLRYSCRKDFSLTVVGCNYELSSSYIDPFLTRCMCTENYSLNAQVRARVESWTSTLHSHNCTELAHYIAEIEIRVLSCVHFFLLAYFPWFQQRRCLLFM